MSKSRNIYRKRGTGSRHALGYWREPSVDGVRKLTHIAIVERVLGKVLPPGVQVHHVDEDRGNNGHENLVVCPDSAYHKLLHVRTAALDACGNANYRKCRFCGVYDDTANMRHKPPVSGQVLGIYEHVACSKTWWNAYHRRRQQQQKAIA